MLRNISTDYKDSNLRTHVWFCIILGINICLLLLACDDMSIHYKEADGVLNSQELAFVIARYSLTLFGQNDYALRLPFILIHTINMLLLYKISRIYLKRPRDSLIVVLIYALLPGIWFSALLVIKSGLIICITLLCCYYQLRFQKMPYMVMLVSVFLDSSFAILLLAFFFFALRNKNTLGIFISLLFFATNMYIYGLDVSGVPRNHFLDNLGKMALFFSPLLLIYYCYTLFNALKKQNNILVYIGVTSMFFVLLLSVRQDVDLQSLFPMSVVAVPVAIRQFFSDMRIRLRPFRGSYVMRFGVIFICLFAQSFILYCNKILYLFGVENHFASSYYISKDIARALHDKGIQSIGVSSRKLAMSLKFYGIDEAKSPYLLPVKNINERYKDEIPIVYLGKKVASFVVVKSEKSSPTTAAQARKQKEKEIRNKADDLLKDDKAE